MKYCLTLLLLFATALLQAQGFYVRLSGGYSLPVFGSKTTLNGYPYTASPPRNVLEPASMYVETDKKSFAAGIPLGLQAGYWFNNHFGVVAGFDHVVDPVRVQSFGAFGLQNGTNTRQQLQITGHMMALQFLNIGMTIKDDDMLKGFYINAGITLSLGNTLIVESHSYPDTTSPSTYSRIKVRCKTGMGLFGIFGYDIPLTKHLSAGLQLSMTALSTWAKDSQLEEYTYNGTNQGTFSQEQLRTIYERNYDPQTGGIKKGPDGEGILPSYQVPLSSLSARVTFSYRF